MNSLRAETRTRSESFRSTRWTLVLATSGFEATPSRSLEALSELCRIYWRPLYLFLRRQGSSPADAQDLTQGFFAELIREDRVYDREWAETLLRQALARLAQECAFAGKGALFEALQSHLSSEVEEAVPYAELAARMQRPAATLRKDVERLRLRYGEILREELRGTLSDPAGVDEELRYLCQALTSQ